VKGPNRNILIAVDDSDNSRRAVEYVAELLGGMPGFKVTVLHVIAEPEEDFFPTAAERDAWMEREGERITQLLAAYREILLSAGFSEEAVKTRSTIKYCPSLAECILQERPDDFGTLVVGRKGRTRTEEFLFGSVSSKIVDHTKEATVWVVS
jgi:nucleotide-binding universal stress UspA family protein